VGFFGAYVWDGSDWHDFDPDADESPSCAPFWLSVAIHDSDFATVRYAPAGSGSGAAYLGYTPRAYFDDESASAPTDVLREADGLATWLARQQGRSDDAVLRELIVSFLAEDRPEQLDSGDEEVDDADDLDEADIFVEVKVARFLMAVGLSVPDELPNT